MKYTKSIFILVIVNLIPLFGVIFYNWSIGSIMLLYWLENIVIGYFNVMRMKKSTMTENPDSDVSKELEGSISGETSAANCKTKGSLISFFIMHYGGFTVVHGVFVITIFFGLLGEKIDFIGVAVGVVGLFVSHGVSYKVNFIETGEYEKVSTQRLFNQPYKRIVILHLVIIIGAFFVLFFNSLIGALILLILLKIIFDVELHIKERRSFQKVVNSGL